MKIKTILAGLSPFALGACATLFPASPFAYDKKGDLVEFTYAWPAEVTRTPPLARKLRSDLEQSFKSTADAAEADRTSAKADGRTFHGHSFARRWTTGGQSSRLLSLDGRTSAFTGGAHANYGSKALLWDRRTAREINVESLLSSPQALAALNRSYCTALDAERSRRRGAVTKPSAMFGECLRFDQVTLVPTDLNRNGRFDTMRVIADPYVAGPFSEGYFVIDRPIDSNLLAAVKPAFRPGFEVGQPQ